MSGKLEVEEIFKRQCEDTSQTFTEVNKKRQKISCQHFDHSYVKKIIRIDFINDDCLREIFMYLSVCERPKIAQVCKNWNRVINSYNFFEVKKIVLSHWEYDCPQNSLEKFKTSEEKFSFLKSLLGKCCIYLTELDLVAYDNSNIVPFINESCPSLVKLRLRLKYPFGNEDLEDAFSHMSKLTVLKIIFQRTPKIPRALIFSLENVASTLNELVLMSQSEGTHTPCQFPSSFLTIIPQLTALKKIETGGMWINSCISEAIVNAKLNFFHHDFIYGILNRLLKCELIYISHIHLAKNEKLTDDILYMIANNFKFLNYLTGNCSLVTDVGIQAISKMYNLKRLYLTGKSHFTNSSSKLLQGFEILELRDNYEITNNSIKNFFENSPYMAKLWFKRTRKLLKL